MYENFELELTPIFYPYFWVAYMFEFYHKFLVYHFISIEVINKKKLLLLSLRNIS